MREITFRGKPVLEECDIELFENTQNFKDGWLYGNLIENNGVPFIVGDIVDADDESISLEFWCPVYPETVGQFTNQIDKNGQKVYEGDIIQGRYTYRKSLQSKGEVKLNMVHGFSADLKSLSNWYSLEVIGNKSDNPELLK